MYPIISLLLVGFFSSSCSFNSPLKFEKVFYSKEHFENCQSSNCPNIQIQSLKASGADQKSKIVNKHIEEALSAIIAFQEDELENISNLKDAVQFFIDDFKKLETDFGNNYITYDLDIYMNVSYQSPKFICIELNYYIFTGGAHGFNSTQFLNFDAMSGRLLSEKELFNHLGSLLEICEANFRLAFLIPEDRSINATGFWFERERFHFPESIGFTKTEMILHYNQYEIASYAEGPIILSIPIEEIAQYLEYY